MSWLLSNGPDLALGAIVAGVVVYVAWKLWSGGGDHVRVEQLEAEQKARDVADQVDNDVGAMSAEARRAELKKWGRDT